MNLDLWLEVDDAVLADAELAAGVPGEDDFRCWVEAALAQVATVAEADALELAIRIVGNDESRALNHDYRGKDQPTNVLSFPADLPEVVLAEIEQLPLGDLVICAPVVRREAGEQGKPVAAHWAHMTVHGVLHLCGHDHVEAEDAARMEPLEIAILARLGWDNPYDDDSAAAAAAEPERTTLQ